MTSTVLFVNFPGRIFGGVVLSIKNKIVIVMLGSTNRHIIDYHCTADIHRISNGRTRRNAEPGNDGEPVRRR